MPRRRVREYPSDVAEMRRVGAALVAWQATFARSTILHWRTSPQKLPHRRRSWGLRMIRLVKRGAGLL
jgi:hypothetical protein